MNTVYSIFSTIWNGAPRIEFDAAWKNGTGYLDKATFTGVDKVMGFVDDHGRRGVIVPAAATDSGLARSFVIFERYSKDSDVLVSNWPGHDAVFTTMIGEDDAQLLQEMLTGRTISRMALIKTVARFYEEDRNVFLEERATALRSLGYIVQNVEHVLTV